MVRPSLVMLAIYLAIFPGQLVAGTSMSQESTYRVLSEVRNYFLQPDQDRACHPTLKLATFSKNEIEFAKNLDGKTVYRVEYASADELQVTLRKGKNRFFDLIVELQDGKCKTFELYEVLP